MAVRLRGVTKSYREGERTRVVLARLDLDVAQGETVVLLGRSGSGKSTLLNLIAGIDRPDAGTVHVAGTELAALDETARTLFRRRHVGFVFQFFNLIPTLTVLENLLLPLELNRRGGPAALAHARELLAEVGLGDRAASYADVLSGGEQQRLALARALVHEPELVLADEPTGNLDEHTGADVLRLLQRLVRARGRTLLLVTHSREPLAMADRIHRLHEGVLVAEGRD
ncbi:MAG: ABC transporter ATP-binding protein [Planctomycetes bacterium]|nr:ABC transporter ATP-binding protein [Planctomycetota bacterium]